MLSYGLTKRISPGTRRMTVVSVDRPNELDMYLHVSCTSNNGSAMKAQSGIW